MGYSQKWLKRGQTTGFLTPQFGDMTYSSQFCQTGCKEKISRSSCIFVHASRSFPTTMRWHTGSWQKHLQDPCCTCISKHLQPLVFLHVRQNDLPGIGPLWLRRLWVVSKVSSSPGDKAKPAVSFLQMGGELSAFERCPRPFCLADSTATSCPQTHIFVQSLLYMLLAFLLGLWTASHHWIHLAPCGSEWKAPRSICMVHVQQIAGQVRWPCHSTCAL